MLYFVYNLVAIILLVFCIIPFFIFRSFKEKGFTKRFRQSLGFFHSHEIKAVAGRSAIWIHGASVGEIVATSPLVKEIRKAFPDVPIVVSAVTTGGYTMAKQIIPEANAVIYFPLDLPLVASMVIERIHPRVFMPVETELWPNFLHGINVRGIPVMMVNGRISDKSVKTYRYLYGILSDMLGSFGRFCMQSKLDAEYIMRLGADPAKVVVTGNTKFDQTYAEVTKEDKDRFYKELGINEKRPAIVAGSTHHGEEKVVIEAFAEVRKKFPDASLLIAPRKTGRLSEIQNIAKEYGFECSTRSALLKMHDRKNYPIILIDTIGELGRLYAVGDVVFVGGSLIKHGGHNVLEPAAHGKPILVGPNMFNFKDSYSLLLNHGAIKTINNAEELSQNLLEILSDTKLKEKMGQASTDVIEENRGAAVKSIVYLKELLKGPVTKNQARDYEINNCSSIEENTIFTRLGFYFYQIIHGNVRNGWDILTLSFLSACSFVYAFGLNIKLAMYKLGVFKEKRLACKVISLGNITLGGTGKTPTARTVAIMISNMGYKVIILNRGYRANWKKPVGIVSDGKEIYMTAYEAGDEAYLLAKQLPDIPVVIGKDRAISGQYVADNMDVDVIIMDDGYQHWQLARDMDIVLIDTLNMFGNGSLLPRGTLREPLSHLRRADLFLLTKVDQSSEYSQKYVKDSLAKSNSKTPIFSSIHKPRHFMEIAAWDKSDRGNVIALEDMVGKSAIAFSAIGNPASFEQTISDLGVKLVETVRYPDHHDYGMMELQYVLERAMEKKADAIIITEKDAVKIPKEFIELDRYCPLYILCIEVKINDEEGAFEAKLKKALDGGEIKNGW